MATYKIVGNNYSKTIIVKKQNTEVRINVSSIKESTRGVYTLYWENNYTGALDTGKNKIASNRRGSTFKIDIPDQFADKVERKLKSASEIEMSR